ncbi:ribosome maturation factor RimM [Ornithinimicrobium sp. Arc0846-15]|nr:ribosome maturation factor RimM [Ornithinimicrobium laminariae]
MNQNAADADFVIARIGKPHGIKGEVTVQVHTDSPETRLVPGAEYATEPASRGPLTIVGVRVHQGTYLLRLDGVADRNAAESLRNTTLVGAHEELDDEEDAWFAEDLIGFAVVTTNGEVVGEVADLHTREVQDLLEVTRTQGPNALIPFVDELVPEIDVDARRVVIDPPAGLLELNESNQ